MSIDSTVLCIASSALDRGRVLPEQISRKILGCCETDTSGDTCIAGDTVAVPSGRAGVKLDGVGSVVDAEDKVPLSPARGLCETLWESEAPGATGT